MISEFTSNSRKIEAKLFDCYKDLAGEIEKLTKEQFIEALRQALPDFERQITLSPDTHGLTQRVIYTPGLEAARYRSRIDELESVLEWILENHHEGAGEFENRILEVLGKK